ncbi:MAG: hypothetical protein CMF26_06315 [Kiloniella sp.]|nr:hypothetical protein [Kiloniella sp.]RZO31817.1 MAG: hypothetical protein EVA88_01665 [Rhodospirillaceae bacterium]
MIRRLLPWASFGLLVAVAFFVGSQFWRASQLPETLTAAVEGTTQAPPAAVWLVLNTAGVLTERFDEVEVYDLLEDDLGLGAWTTRHEDRNYLTRFTRIEAVQGGNGDDGDDGPWVYSYRIDAEDVPVQTLREVRFVGQGDGSTVITVTDQLTIEDSGLRLWMGVLGIDSGAKNELKALTSLAVSASAAL